MASNEKETSLLQGNNEDKLSIDLNYIKPESRLQSLGFTMDNGKARFILGDDAAAYSNAALGSFNVVDCDNSLSFVVLGKDSLDCIEASSLASYVDIQEKSMSIDYGSMITSCNLNEIQEKLRKVLHENTMLKETLKQNNVSMKKQFNTLSDWHEEIMKIHQNHKKKFAETRELINYLKKENTELKVKLIAEEPNNTEMGYEIPSASSLQYAVKEKEPSTPEKELEEKVSFLTAELNNSKLKCEKLTADIENLSSISKLMSSKLMEATSIIQQQRLNIKKLEVETSISKFTNSNYFDQSLDCATSQSKSVNKYTECEDCLKKDKENNALEECIAVLTQKLQDINILVNTCNEQVANFTVAATSPNELKETIKKVPSSSMTSEYSDYFTQITTVENRLQQAFVDCNTLVSELKTTLKANTEDSIMNKSDVFESARHIEEQNANMKESLEQEKLSLNKEREQLETEKSIFNEQKKSFESELKDLNNAKELLRQEKMCLHEEKSSLDQQSQLYENHYKKTLEEEKNKFEAKYAQLVSEIGNLHESIQKKELRIKELQSEVALHLENISLLQTQLKLYEEDFKTEKSVKESLLDGKNNLDTDLQKQIEYNVQLQEEINRLKLQINRSASVNPCDTTGLEPPLVSTFACPKCDTVFRDMTSLEHHLDRCLSLD